jgi:hypothetical protein
MSGSPDIVPGTVSKILWHFTGGPTWNDKTKKQNTSPKPSKNAYRNVKCQLLCPVRVNYLGRFFPY